MRSAFLFTTFFLSLVFVPSLAMAQDADERLRRLEQEVQTLNQAVYRGVAPEIAPPSADSVRAQADAQAQIVTLEAQLRQMNGVIERQNYDIQQMKMKLDRALADMDLRFQALERGGLKAGRTESSSKAATPDQPPKTLPVSSLAPLKPVPAKRASVNDASQRYDAAFSLLKNGQYDEAESALKGFLQSHPNHKLAGNAHYWLGESYYVRGKYADAVQAFAEGFRQEPKGAKAPDNLLKLGMSLSALGKKDDACLSFAQIEKEFSDAVGGPVHRRAKQEMSRLGC